MIDIKRRGRGKFIRAIVRHKVNNANMYVFLVIDWFQAIGGEDELLDCPYYMLQKAEETRWRRVYTITIFRKLILSIVALLL